MNKNISVNHDLLKDKINKLNVTNVAENKQFNVYYLKTNKGIIKVKSELEPTEFYKSINLKKK